VLSSNATLTVLVPPQQLSAPAFLPDGSFVLTSRYADGSAIASGDLAAFEAQASTNLVNWVVLTNALTWNNGVLQLRDAGSTNYPVRFYRMVEH
jgi:hypothetical protein